MTKAEFIEKVRAVAEQLKQLADAADAITDARQDARDEASEHMREAGRRCEDAIDAITAFRP